MTLLALALSVAAFLVYTLKIARPLHMLGPWLFSVGLGLQAFRRVTAFLLNTGEASELIKEFDRQYLPATISTLFLIGSFLIASHVVTTIRSIVNIVPPK